MNFVKAIKIIVISGIITGLFLVFVAGPAVKAGNEFCEAEGKKIASEMSVSQVKEYAERCIGR
jgi:hypothetical protein